MKIGLVIPWRSYPDRTEALDAVLNWYKENFPGIPIFFADRGGEHWQHSASRNDGVKQAQEAHCDLVIINDADTIPELDSLNSAIQAAKADRFIHNPYTICKYLSDHYTKQYLNKSISLKDIPSGSQDKIYDANGIKEIWEINWACGGIFVCQTDAWWDLGGMDEKIVHGPEDLCFQRVHEVVKGIPIVKHNGTIYALSHKQRERVTMVDRIMEFNNLRLYNLYMNENNPKNILELVKKES